MDASSPTYIKGTVNTTHIHTTHPKTGILLQKQEQAAFLDCINNLAVENGECTKHVKYIQSCKPPFFVPNGFCCLQNTCSHEDSASLQHMSNVFKASSQQKK